MTEAHGCSREAEAVRLARGEHPGEEIRSHVAACPVCGEIVRLATDLRVLAVRDGARPLPPAAQLWWKAQIVRRLSAREHLDRSLDAMQWLQIASGIAVALLLLVWQIPVVARAIGGFAGAVHPLTAVVAVAAPTRPLLIVALTSAALTLLVSALVHVKIPAAVSRRPR